MNYLKSAIMFFLKNWLIAIPLFILMAIPALITGTANSLTDITKVWTSLSDPSQINNLGKFFSLAWLILPMAVGGGILAFICQFVSMPATYGLVNDGLSTGKTDLNNIGRAISTNFVKYIMYFVGMIAVWLSFSVIALIVIGIFMLIRLYAFVVLLFIVFGAAALIISVLLSFWFSAMVIDNYDVFAAAKKSIEIARGSFWTLIGIYLLVTIAGSIVSGILSFLNAIPLLGPIITSAVPAATTFVLIIFYMLIYREKTGKYSSAPIA